MGLLAQMTIDKARISPACHPDAYVSHAGALYRVVRIEEVPSPVNVRVWLENALDGVTDPVTGDVAYHQHHVPGADVIRDYKLVRAAPIDMLEDAAT